MLVLLCLLNFVSAFLKNWTFQLRRWLYLTKISHFKNIRYVTSSPWRQGWGWTNPTEAIFPLVQDIVFQLMALWVRLSTYLLFVIKLFNTVNAFFRIASVKYSDLKSPDRQRQPLEEFYRERFSSNFLEFTGKYQCWSLFFNKVAGGGLQLYLKRDSGTGVFLWILRNTLSTDNCFQTKK